MPERSICSFTLAVFFVKKETPRALEVCFFGDEVRTQTLRVKG
jgi:hypothetical protein